MTSAGQPDERGHKVIKYAIDRGYVTTGAVYPLDGFPSHDSANESRQVINRAGDHLGVSVAAWVVDGDGEQCFKDCQDPAARHGVRFRLFIKSEARKKVVKDSGGDPAKMKYSPFRKAEKRIVDDHGKRIS